MEGCELGEIIWISYSYISGFSRKEINGGYITKLTPRDWSVCRLSLTVWDASVDERGLEWLWICGVSPDLPELRFEAEYIVDHSGSDGVCDIPFYEKRIPQLGPYSGMQLATDWRAGMRRLSDLTFRAMMILFFSGKTVWFCYNAPRTIKITPLLRSWQHIVSSGKHYGVDAG